jgi:hypothetical protein
LMDEGLRGGQALIFCQIDYPVFGYSRLNPVCPIVKMDKLV